MLKHRPKPHQDCLGREIKGCTHSHGHPTFLKICLFLALSFTSITVYAENLTASWYSVESLKKEGTWKHGEQKMANGKRFDENALTCASRIHRLGAVVEVINKENGKSVTVVCTDRIGKRFAKTRIDLSKAAFYRICDLRKGIVKVEVKEIK
jgi:rare lipoprotein A